MKLTLMIQRNSKEERKKKNYFAHTSNYSIIQKYTGLERASQRFEKYPYSLA